MPPRRGGICGKLTQDLPSTRLQGGTRQESTFLQVGSCLRLIDSCITQLKAQGPSRTCNESKEVGRQVRAAQVSDVGVPSTLHPKMCSGSEAGSYLRLIDFVDHSTLGFPPLFPFETSLGCNGRIWPGRQVRDAEIRDAQVPDARCI